MEREGGVSYSPAGSESARACRYRAAVSASVPGSTDVEV